jgi:hypothetical protein
VLGRIRSIFHLLEVNEMVRALGDDVIQPGRSNSLVVALKLHSGIACRHI